MTKKVYINNHIQKKKERRRFVIMADDTDWGGYKIIFVNIILVIIVLILLVLVLWLFGRTERELTQRESGRIHEVFQNKLMGGGKLNPNNLKREMDATLATARMANTTNLKRQPNYEFVDRMGNEFNQPVRPSGSNLKEIMEEDDIEWQKESESDFLREFQFLVLEEYSGLFGGVSSTLSCRNPLEVDSSVDCQIFCRDENAVKFENTLATYQGTILQPEKVYCYVPPGGTETEPPRPNQNGVRCSQYAGLMVWISNRERWLCHCTYPFLFRGPQCTENRACLHDPYKHWDNPNWDNEVFLVDEVNSSRIITHSDLAKSSLFTTLRNADYGHYKKYINEPYFFLKNRISCSCDGQRDYLGNTLPDQSRLNRDFLDFTKCHINPCKLNRLDEGVVAYDPNDFTCNPTDTDIHDNVSMGDRSTPFAGEVPLFGLRKREVEPEATSGEIKNAKTDDDDKTVRLIASMVGPVITPKNTDHTDKTKFVMYFAPDQINLAGRSFLELKKYHTIPEIYTRHGDALPNLTNRTISAVAAYGIYPVENALANHTPQNPVDFNLLANQSMENSFMVSGMIVGGHETLFHSIFDAMAKSNRSPSKKMTDMFKFFKATRLKGGRVMTSSRITERHPAPIFESSMSQTRKDAQQSSILPYSRKLNAAASVRSYRIYGLLDSLSNLHENYNVRGLFNKRNMDVQLIFPTSLYKLDEESHFYRDESKMISNRLEIMPPSTKDLNSPFILSFSATTHRNVENIEHRQYADLWVPNNMSLHPSARRKGELFDRNLIINENVTPAYQASFFEKLMKKKVRPLNLHHILAVSSDDFIKNITKDPRVRKIYEDTSQIAASLTWSNTFNTKHYDDTLIFE